MSSKVVRKAYPDEKVGVIGMRSGRLGVIEYSDLGELVWCVDHATTQAIAEAQVRVQAEDATAQVLV